MLRKVLKGQLGLNVLDYLNETMTTIANYAGNLLFMQLLVIINSACFSWRLLLLRLVKSSNRLKKAMGSLCKIKKSSKLS